MVTCKVGDQFSRCRVPRNECVLTRTLISVFDVILGDKVRLKWFGHVQETKVSEDGAARQKEKTKTSVEMCGCREGGHGHKDARG